MNKNGNFCKETNLSKVIVEAKVDAHAVSLKKFDGFSWMSVVFWVQVNGCLFATIDVIFIGLHRLLEHI